MRDSLQNMTYLSIKDKKQKKLVDVVSIDSIWTTSSGVKILSYAGFLALAKEERVVEKKIATEVYPTEDNLQQHVVNIWLGQKGEKDEDNWSRGSGEASRLNTGKLHKTKDGKSTYIEHGEIDSSYRYAMAEKRAFCRAMQKHLNLSGIYADVEAAAFQKPTKNEMKKMAKDGDYDY